MRSQVSFLLVALVVPLIVHADEPPIRWKPIGPGGGGFLTAPAVARFVNRC